MSKAIVLLSGGMDSTTVLYIAKSEDYDIYALSFDYGQRHNKEINCAKKIAEIAGVKEHIIIKTNMNTWGGSALTDNTIEIPDSIGNKKDIPVTYVPARNMIFLSYAASYAEAIGAQDIFIGVSEVDYSGYVDCRQQFLDAMENAINMGTVCAVEGGKRLKIHAPLVQMSKADELKLGIRLGVDYSLTWTCYRGGDFACGACDSCKLRLKAFKEIGGNDPIPYKNLV